MTRWVLIAGAVLAGLLVVGLVGRFAGADDPGSGRFDPPPPTDAAPSGEEAARITAGVDRYYADLGCSLELVDVADRLEALDTALEDGLGYDPYEARVRAARRAWEAADVARMPQACREGVVGELEAALAAYERAGSIWLICIRDPGCSLDGIGPRLDEEWAEAGRQLEAART